MKKNFVGIDISKSWLDYAVCRKEQMKLSSSEKVDNNVSGIIAMLNALCRVYPKDSLWFCFEHTGNYGLLLSSILQTRGFTYSAVPALEVKKSMGIARGKSDQIDAGRLAEYAATKTHKLRETQLPSNELLQIKNLLTYRAQLVKVRTQFTNSLKSYRTAGEVVDLGFICSDIESAICDLENKISGAEQQIHTLIMENKELEKNYSLISSVKGIGAVAGAVLLVYTGNFTSFDNPRKFNCFTGIAPFEESSGIKVKQARTSNFRHKYIKTILYNGANSAAYHDPQLRKYYKRKTAEGKKHLSVINAIACKLIARAFATVKRQSPYVVLAN